MALALVAVALTGCSPGGDDAGPTTTTTAPPYIDDPFVSGMDALCISSEATARSLEADAIEAVEGLEAAGEAGDLETFQFHLDNLTAAVQGTYDGITALLADIEALGVPEEHRATIDELRAMYAPQLTAAQQGAAALAAGDVAGFDAIADAAPDPDRAKEQELADRIGAPSCGPG
jgi:hypothetical protein